MTTSMTIELASPFCVLVNGRSYAIPKGCRFLVFRLSDGVPVDFDTKRSLAPFPALASAGGKAVGT